MWRDPTALRAQTTQEDLASAPHRWRSPSPGTAAAPQMAAAAGCFRAAATGRAPQARRLRCSTLWEGPRPAAAAAMAMMAAAQLLQTRAEGLCAGAGGAKQGPRFAQWRRGARLRLLRHAAGAGTLTSPSLQALLLLVACSRLNLCGLRVHGRATRARQQQRSNLFLLAFAPTRSLSGRTRESRRSPAAHIPSPPQASSSGDAP